MQLPFSKTIRGFIYILLASAAFIFLLWLLKPSPVSFEIKDKVWNIHTEVVKYGIYTPNVVLHGVVESPHHATLRTSLNEDVTAVPVREGMTVTKGQLLIQLDKRNSDHALIRSQSEVAAVESRFTFQLQKHEQDQKQLSIQTKLLNISQKQVKRVRSLRKQNLTSPAKLDEALRELHQHELTVNQIKLNINEHDKTLALLKLDRAKAQAALQQATIDAEHTTIRAPFDAKITKVFIAPGDHLMPGANLISLYDYTHMEIRAQLPAKLTRLIINALHEKQKLTAIITHPPMQDKPLPLVRISSSIESGLGGANVFIDAAIAAKTLQLGETVSLLLDLPPVANAIRIPETALFKDHYVYIVHSDKLQRVQVNIKGSIKMANGSQSYIITSSKISPNQQLLITHLANARTGLNVKMMRPTQ